jgi:hypothetical protein
MSFEVALSALEAALEGERAALVALDSDALLRFGEQKLAALDQIGAAASGDAVPAAVESRLRLAFEQHQGNASLLLRRRQETSWLLQTLGAVAPASAYDAHGGRNDSPLPRRLAEA